MEPYTLNNRYKEPYSQAWPHPVSSCFQVTEIWVGIWKEDTITKQPLFLALELEATMAGWEGPGQGCGVPDQVTHL